MAEKKNALADLAERLTDVLAFAQDELFLEHKQTLDKAQRIVAELAKPDRVDGRIACEIIAKCRAIAEEGAGNGK